MINVASVKLFRQIILTKEPIPLYNLFKHGQINNVNTRCISKYYAKFKPILADTKGFFVHKVTEIWNSLPPKLHNISNELFNKRIKTYTIKKCSHDKLHRDGRYIII